MDNREYTHTEKWPYHISAGGVPYEKREDGRVFVALVCDKSLNGEVRYNLPKGTLHYNETLEDCAKREVHEESGCVTEIMGFLGGLNREYHSRDKGGLESFLTDKVIIYFAMRILDREEEHDAEYDFVEMVEIDEAIRLLEQTRPEKEEYEIVTRLKKFLEMGMEKEKGI